MAKFLLWNTDNAESLGKFWTDCLTGGVAAGGAAKGTRDFAKKLPAKVYSESGRSLRRRMALPKKEKTRGWQDVALQAQSDDSPVASQIQTQKAGGEEIKEAADRGGLAMQHMRDDLGIALVTVAALGCVLAGVYMIYHSAMIAVCYYRDTSPEERAHTRLTYRPSSLPNAAKVHHRKALMGMSAFCVFFLLVVGGRLLFPN